MRLRSLLLWLATCHLSLLTGCGPLYAQPVTSPTDAAVMKTSTGNLTANLSTGNKTITVASGGTLNIASVGTLTASAGSTINLSAGNVTLPDGVALPSQATHSGKFLTTNGTAASWSTTLPSVSVADGFTLTSAGSIELAAGGTNENIILSPSGTGYLRQTLPSDSNRALWSLDLSSTTYGDFRKTYEVSNNDVGARPNRIMGFGYNYAPGGSAAVAGEPAMAWIIESFFKPDSSAGYVEGHLQYTTIGSSGLIRPLSTKILRDTTVAGSTTTTTVMGDSVSIVDTSAVPRITVSSGGMFLGNSTSIYQSTNNVAAIFGRKTDSVDLELLKVNASNAVVVGAGAITINSTTNAATFAGAISGTSATMSSLTSGRVPIVSTSGLITDDADLTFSTDTLTATKGTFGNITHVSGAISTTTGNLTIGTGSGSGGALILSPDGGGGVTVASAAGTQLTVREASNGTGKFRVTNGASGVNYLEISNDSSPKFTTNDGQIYFLKTIAAQGTVNLRDFTDISNLQGFIEGVELAGSPAAPASNKFRIYAKDNGAGKTVLYVRFASGAEQQIAIEP